MADNDILFQADVDDKTIQFFERFDANLDRIATSSEKGFETVERSAKNAGKEIGVVAGLVGSLNAKLLEMAMKGAAALKNYVAEATQLRARVDVLGTTLNLVGQKAGFTADQISATEEELKNLGITTSSARQSLILMARANIDWSEASNLAIIAQNSAVVAGMNSSQAFERLVRGIQKQEPELLDELGITLKRTDAYKRLADELGINVKQLDEQQKQQAILNDIYRQSGVVAGAYEAAMGNVGKQVTSLPRHMEELQLAIGGAFQPAYALQVEVMTEKLKQLREWVDENQEGLELFGQIFVRALETTVNALEKILEVTGKIPAAIERAGVGLAKLFTDMDDAQVEQQAQQNVTYERFIQFISLIVGGINAVIEATTTLVSMAAEDLKALWAFVTGDDPYVHLDKMAELGRNFGDNMRRAFEEGTIASAEFFGIINNEAPQAEESMQEVATATEEIAEAADGAEEAMAKVNDAFKDLKERMDEELEQKAIQEFRRQVEERLQTSFRIEDIERNHQERLADIRKQATERSKQFEEDKQEALINLHTSRTERALEIEQDYQKRLREIEENFQREASELARSRDAIGLLRLMRQKRLELDEEQKAAAERRKENEESFQKQLASLQKSLAKQEQELQESIQEQIAALEEQREREYEALERQLDRQRQLRELHNQWEEEDRQRRFQKELEDMAEQFSSIEGLTQEGLDEILAVWEEHFGDLSALRDEYMEIQAEMADVQAGAGFGSRYGGEGFRGSLPTNPIERKRELFGDDYDVGVYGQAGQVSSALANAAPPASYQPAMFTPGQVSRLPSVRPQGRNVEYKEILVRAEGFDPIVQRQVVQILTEIERNKG